MLFYGCIYIGVSGPLIQYLGPGGGWGCGPEQLAATVACTSVYNGCIATARRTQLFCNSCVL